jgi:two-component system, cell cycle sensor histidine kinase and response regulator CckA
MGEEQCQKTSPAWFDSFPELVFIMDREGVILDANEAFAARFQKLPKECVGNNVYALLPSEIASCRREKAEKVFRSKKEFSWEDERNNRILRNTIYPTLSRDGEVTQLLIICQDVTDLKLSELKLKNEQAISKTIIESIPGAFYILDANGRYVGWNSYQRDTIVGKSEFEMACVEAIDTIHPDDRPLISKKILNVFTLGNEEVIEGRVLLRGGPEFRWFLMTGNRIIINGAPFLIGMGIDITERKQGEETLQQNEERFRRLFESHSAIQLILDPDTGYIVNANQAAEDFYGWSIETLKQMHINEINTLPPEEVTQVLKKWVSSQQLSFNFRHLRADNSIRDVEVFANKVDINGKAFIYCIIHDVNQRKHLERLSAFRIFLFEMAATHSVEALLLATIDEAEQLTDSAIGFCNLFGNNHLPSAIQVMSTNMQKSLRREAATGGAHPSLNKTGLWGEAIEKRDAVINNKYNAIEDGIKPPNSHALIMRTLVVPLLEGERVVATLGVVNKGSNYDDEDRHWVKMVAEIAWDIIAKKLADEELDKLQCQLQHFQKMELVGQLAGGIAHDFNNMLGVIIGYTDMMMEQFDTKQPIYESLEIIRKAASHSADLTSQLLTFARKQTILTKILSINSVIEEMLPMLRQLVGETITLVWVAETRRMQVKIDPLQIKQILANLCINARDAITGTGRITIETGMVHIDTLHGASSLPCLVPGKYAALTVSDNGSGIKKKDLPHIFEPFFTTKEVGKVTGMGLSTVYGIVKQNNGSIECESKSGEGCLFRVLLPLFKESAVQTESGQQKTEPERNAGCATILVVEDETDILKLCQIILESRGYRVLTAFTISEAINIAIEYDGPINLLLTDVVMPEINGNELSKKLRIIRPDLKTLFMSGYTADIISHPQIVGDDINFIQKPFSTKALINAVYGALNP